VNSCRARPPIAAISEILHTARACKMMAPLMSWRERTFQWHLSLLERMEWFAWLLCMASAAALTAAMAAAQHANRDKTARVQEFEVEFGAGFRGDCDKVQNDRCFRRAKWALSDAEPRLAA
jgi:hypothetical protein